MTDARVVITLATALVFGATTYDQAFGFSSSGVLQDIGDVSNWVIYGLAVLGVFLVFTNVEPLDGFWIRASFSDGAVKEIDLSELIGRGSVFAPIRDHREVFNQVHVNPETHTIEWLGEVDLDPAVLYGRFEPASGMRIVPRTDEASSVRSTS